MLNVGESPRGEESGAPRWFVFLSNRKKKKENTSLDAEIAPTPFPGWSMLTPAQVVFEVLWSNLKPESFSCTAATLGLK